MPSTYKLTPIDPPSSTPEQMAESIKKLAKLNDLDPPTASLVSAMWSGYARVLHGDGEFARRKLDVLQCAADVPSMN